MNTNTVYVVQDPEGKEILPAKKFGRLHVILGGREPAEEAVVKLKSALKGMQPDDYLLQIGSPLNIGVATHLALAACGGILQLLVWDRINYEYNLVQIKV